MAEVNAKDLTTKTSPASTDSMLLFGTTSNEGAKITVDNLADNILSRLSTKTFANQVGGSSAATLLSQLSTLNSKIRYETFNFSVTDGWASGKTIGTRVAQETTPANVQSGEYIIGIAITYIGASNLFIPMVFFSGNMIYCNYYAASTAGATELQSTITARVAYLKT